MNAEPQYGIDMIMRLLPHREPFLFVDAVSRLVPDRRIVTLRTVRADEPWFAGHFPKKPILPGVLVVDALAQTGGLLWGLSKVASGREPPGRPELFYLAAANVKFVAPAFPGDVLEMTAEADRQFGALFSYAVEATAKRKTVAKGTLTLAMVKGEL